MLKDRITAYFSDKREEFIHTLSRLVRIPSVKSHALPGKPFGEGPARALDEAILIARELGLSSENLEGYVGVADLSEKETALHILAHLDVVEPGSGWTVTTAYEPKMVGDFLYGRGTTDDKGPLLAALFAMKAVQELDIPLSYNARLIMGTDEESGFSDIAWYYGSHPYAPYTFSPDAEFPVTNLEKGHFQPFLTKKWPRSISCPIQVLELTGSPQVNLVPAKANALVSGLTEELAMPLCHELEAALSVTFRLTKTKLGLSIAASGKNTHASTPQNGVNALTALIQLLTRLPLSDCEDSRTLMALSKLFPHGDHLGEALGIAQADPLSGPLTLAFTMISMDEDGLRARFDCRTSLDATEENCLHVAKANLAAHGILLEGSMTPAHYTPADTPFVQTLLRAYTLYTGGEGICLSTGGGTYVHGIPGAVAFGATMPYFDAGIHEPNEKVSIPDLLTAAEIFTQVIADLCQ